MNSTLLEILAPLDMDYTLSHSSDTVITGISHSSSLLQPGNIFVAITGYKHDGHDFIQDAIDKGAAAIVAEREISAPIPVIKVENSRIALAELSNIWYGFPAQDMKLLGITASNGKTTTAFMLDYILSAHFQHTGLLGTVVIKDGKQAVSADLTTPDSLELFSWLARMRKNNCSHVTMEVSSAGQQLHRVHGIPYHIATFNNLTREHVDFHGSFDRYWQQKSKLIKDLSAQAIAVLNADDPQILSLKEQTVAAVVTYSLKDAVDIQVKDIDLSTGVARFNYIIPQDLQHANFNLPATEMDIQLKVLGLHNVYNATVAITVAKLCGVPDDVIIQSLKTFGGVERRFQLIYDQDFKIIDDHFANAGNINLTLETLGLMKYNKLHLLHAIRGNRGVVVNKENAETVCDWVPHLPMAQLITTDSVDFVDERDEVSSEERQVFHQTLQQSDVEFQHVPSLTQSIYQLLKDVQPGDVVLLAGCQGMDHAAHVIIPPLAERYSKDKQQEVLQVLKNRVAGSS